MSDIESGGEGGIRTLDRAFQPYNGLANRCLKPLGHLSTLPGTLVYIKIIISENVFVNKFMAEEKKQTDRGSLLLNWRIPEYEKYERGKSWYIWAGIAFGLLVVYAIYTLNFLFVVILILAAVITVLRSISEPDEVDFGIFEDGVGVGGKFYTWKDVDKFYIIYEPPDVKNLYFNPNGLRSRISVPLLDQNPLKVREVLLKYLIEDTDQEHEPLSESYSRFLKI